MSFLESINTHRGKRRVYDIIFFAFLSSFIAALENFFPRPIPYFRIGFSFIVILFILDYFKISELLLLVLIKNISVSIVFAYIFTPPFYLGVVGGLCSVIIMKFFRFMPNVFSFFGVSLIGSLSSNLSQAFLAKYLFSLPSIQFLIIPVLILSLITGSVVGIFTLFFNKNLKNN